MKPLRRPDLWMATLVVAVSALAAVFILEYVRYPYPIWHGLVFRYLLFHQDLVGLALLAMIALLACIPATHRPALALVEAIGRRPGLTAGVVFVVLCAGMFAVAQNHGLAGDEYLTLMQSRIFAEGRLTGEWPPDLLPWLMADTYRYRWIMVNAVSGEVTSIYWPGFAVLLTPFSLARIPWALNPLLAAIALLLMARIATRVTGEAQAGGWAMLLAIASPGFSGLALSYFAMTAHLVFSLFYAWLLIERGSRGAFAAGLVGSFALLLHNPVPHILFSLPWIAWLALQPEGRRNLAWLALGYLPGLALGLAWAVFMKNMHGPIFAAPFPQDGELAHQIGNLVWYWDFRSRTMFSAPYEYSIQGRIGEQVRLWAWAVPGLPILAAAGWWLGRRNRHLNLLALSLVSILVGYIFVRFDQGYGWGARYVHPAWGALPILGAAAIVLWPRQSTGGAAVRGWVASAALLSLVFATGLRWWQIHDYIAEHLARRPPFVEGVRQFVFVHYDVDYYYDQDLVQNDPFLRDPVVFLLSRGRKEDYEMMRRRYPNARQVYDGSRGHVWRLD
jgi:hypothetical protein